MKLNIVQKYPNLYFTLFLFLLLVPPFFLRLRYRNLLEIYPAILLPSGSHKVDLKQSEVSFEQIKILGKNQLKNTWDEVDTKSFLDPIPIQYSKNIIKNSFGLKSADGKTFVFPFGYQVFTKKITFEEVEDTKNWLAQKLREYGYASDRIQVRLDRVVLNTQTGEIIVREITYEEVFRLD